MQNVQNGIAAVLFAVAMFFLYTGMEFSIKEEEEREFHFSPISEKIKTLNQQMKLCYFVSGLVFFFGMFVASRFF